MENAGIELRMDFKSFVQAVADTSDDEADVHFVSQSTLLSCNGNLVPHFIGRFEHIDNTFHHISAEVEKRSGIGLGDMPKKNARRSSHSHYLEYFHDQELLTLAVNRYRNDFENFYNQELTMLAARCEKQ